MFYLRHRIFDGSNLRRPQQYSEGVVSANRTRRRFCDGNTKVAACHRGCATIVCPGLESPSFSALEDIDLPGGAGRVLVAVVSIEITILC